MALSRKNYEAVAKVVSKISRDFSLVAGEGDSTDENLKGYDRGAVDALTDVRVALADYFASDNPRFDRERFLKACGVES